MGLPDIRKTIYLEIIEHLENDPSLTEGVHYMKNDQVCGVRFRNGSEIIAISFGDRKYGKVKSLKLSGVILEEGTEFAPEFYEDGGGFKLLKGRLRRIHNVPENFMIVATNPDEPDHPLYDYFIEGEKEHDSRHVFYSVTTDNKFLDPVYIKQLRQDYSPLEALRYLEGQWISIKGKGIYAAYDPDKNYKPKAYRIRENLPLRISFDFNISANKPMSCVCFQFDEARDTAHFFDEAVIEGSYTEDIMEDLWERGLLEHKHIIIHGDATGRARTPASKLANYDIIKQYLEQKRVAFEIQVPRANPPIRERHRLVNAYCENVEGDRRLFIYKKAKTAHIGMRTTKLKAGANFIEDDSKKEQHITTAIGYGLYMAINQHKRKSGTIKL